MSSSLRSSLRPLLQQFGIQSSYEAASRETVYASDDAALAVLRALGVDVSGDIDDIIMREQEQLWSNMMGPVVLAWDGRVVDFPLRISVSAARRTINYEILFENGETVGATIPPSQRRERGKSKLGRYAAVELIVSIPLIVPPGYHKLIVRTTDAEAQAILISAPRRCHSGDRPREWGVFAPLYAIRENRDKGIGDFDDLQKLMKWVGEMDGDLVATLPISAGFLREPFDPSPYSPASRLFWNEVFLSGLKTEDANELVDYRAVAASKRAQLEQAARSFFRENGEATSRFRDFLLLYPDAPDYAAFHGAVEKYRAGWPTWPQPARDGTLSPADINEDARQYHLYVQMLAHEQLSAVAMNCRDAHVRLYLDMPLGVHPDSYDVWRYRDRFVTGASAGAPPDPFFTKGQDWGFPPMNPYAMRRDGYVYWRKVLQTQLRYAGMLRLDHVMSLHRLYFVPHGFEATQGVYVRYPAEELYAVLALESVRHQAAIVGEDLGTVPAEVRKSMADHGVKRMYVVQFEAAEKDPPINEVPKEAVCSLNTHDMPPFRSYWEGQDATLRHEIGLINEAEVETARASRQELTTALSRYLNTNTRLNAADARTALLRYLARSKADILLVNLEDLWLETEPQNVPGTGQERPNWRRRLKYTLEEIRTNREILKLLEMIDKERRS